MEPVFDESWLAGLETTPIQLDIDLRGYDGPRWVAAPLLRRSGWLLAAEAKLLTPFEEARRTFIVGITDDGHPIGSLRATALLSAPVGHVADPGQAPPISVAEQVEPLWWDFLGSTDLETLNALDEAERETGRSVSSERAKFDAMRDKIERMDEQLSRERRYPDCSDTRRDEIDAQRERLDAMMAELAAEWPRRLASMRAPQARLQERAWASLKRYGEIRPVWGIRWRALDRVGWRGDDDRPLLPGWRRPIGEAPSLERIAADLERHRTEHEKRVATMRAQWESWHEKREQQAQDAAEWKLVLAEAARSDNERERYAILFKRAAEKWGTPAGTQKERSSSPRPPRGKRDQKSTVTSRDLELSGTEDAHVIADSGPAREERTFGFDIAEWLSNRLKKTTKVEIIVALVVLNLKAVGCTSASQRRKLYSVIAETEALSEDDKTSLRVAIQQVLDMQDAAELKKNT